MIPISIILPEELTTYLEEQITSGHYATPSDYIQALIQQDQDRKAHLETLMLEALDSPSSSMTSSDWDTIRASVRQRLNPGQPNLTPA